MKKIAIIGTGISGLYLANLLEMDHSFEYKIYEKPQKFNLEESYGIQLSVNCIKLLNKIDFKYFYQEIFVLDYQLESLIH